MSDKFVESFVEKLILLERRAGADVRHQIMSPFEAMKYDHLSLQELAKEIAEFVDLGSYTFVVGAARQREKVGGHIDLSTKGVDVFIEIDSDTLKHPDAAAATLCHEVTHKWLQVRGLEKSVKMENEILTDIASVFLGFGKIMLNGCKVMNVRTEMVDGGTRTITETKTSGYLDRDQLAFVYSLVCAMRSISETDMREGLSLNSSQALQSCDSMYGHYYNARLHAPESMRESVSMFNSYITDVQYDLANLDRHIGYTKQSFLEIADSFLRSSHREIVKLRGAAGKMLKDAEPDPALRFLQVMQNQQTIGRMSKDGALMKGKSDSLLEHAKMIGRHLSSNSDHFPVPTASMFTIVTCPQDGTKLRLPEKSGSLIATCPTCKYSFAYNTNVPEFSGSIPLGHVQSPLKKLGVNVKKYFDRIIRN